MAEHSSARENRLAHETSPYLLLHRHNPVDWYPWGEEALARARAEDKPIFLSVGYSTCYWCHVMERESFSNPAVAALMNRAFVNVKLDREERPDLDEIYMTATQFIAEQGGWPNSVFLTPELKPFFAGTYFPPADRYGRPGFPKLIEALAEAWRERRDDIETQADEVAEAMRRHLEERAAPGQVPGVEAAERSLQALGRRFDPTHGGFGTAPKFPTPSNLLLLAELAPESEEAGRMLAATLDRMARGGIYDQIGGGFHRYSTDREWRVPHFEKMLYDNGLLLEAYAREHARTGDPETARVARETAEWMRREMSPADQGGFWSAIDAETDGDEGAFYVWRERELVDALGPEDAQFLAPLYGFDGGPFFEGGRYVLHLPERVAEAAERRRVSREVLWTQIDPLRARLFAARAERPRPATDDKVLAEWNGMAIAGLATAGEILGERWMIDRAAAAADFLLSAMRAGGGPLRRTWRGGEAKIPAFLGDYAYCVRGLLALRRATGEARWLDAARDLFAELEERLGDPRGGWFTAAASADVLFRSKDIFDGATPAASAVAALAAIDLAALTGEQLYLDSAARALASAGALVEHQVEAARTMTVAARRLRALAGDRLPAAAPPSPQDDPLAREALAVLHPHFEVSEPDAEGWCVFSLKIEIAEGFHLHADLGTAEGMIATRLAGDGVELRALRSPAGRPLAVGGEVIQALRGTVEFRGELRETSAAPRLLLRYQACDERRCLPAVTVGLMLAHP